MKTRNRFVQFKSFIVLVTTILISACGTDSPKQNQVVENWEIDESLPPSQRHDMSLDAKTSSTADGLKRFYPEFTKEVVNFVDQSIEMESKNVVLSPLSAEIVLGMLANSIDDVGRDAILDYLNVADINDLNNLNNDILEFLPDADNRAVVKFANSLWYDSLFSLNPNFSNVLKGSYQCEILAENFSDSNNLKQKINNWGAEKTNNLIKETIQDVNPFTLAYLINALYFKGLWADKTIVKENTKNKSFFGSSCTPNVPTMESYAKKFKYASNDDFEMLSIPYGNGTYSFTVILPKVGLTLSEANAKLTAESFESLKQNANMKLICFNLPKFNLSSSIDLEKILYNSKLKEIFEVRKFNIFKKDFNGLLQMNQNVSIMVNENGAEAASTSIADIPLESPITETTDPYIIEINRPFYFFIEETSSGVCLISGRIADL